jgi:ABC-type multidrug transport system fused ATPase/permease subunit
MCFCCKKNIIEETTEEDLENPNIEEEEEEIKTVSLGRILAFEPKERPKMIIGSIFAFLNGGIFPAFTVLLGELISSFFTKSGPELYTTINYFSAAFLGIALFNFMTNYFMNVLWMIAGEKTSAKIRDKYFRALQRQEIGYFDKHLSGTLTINSDIELIKSGISEKLASIINSVAQLIAGLITAFVYCWQLTLVMLGTFIIMCSVMTVSQKLVTNKTIKGQKLFAKVNAVVSESLLGVRTVYSFVGELLVSEKHSQLLAAALKNNKCKAQLQSIFLGITMCLMFCSYCVGFYYGGRLVYEGTILPGEIIVVFFSIMMGTMGLSTVATFSTDISKAQGAATQIFALLDREPLIDASEEVGIKQPINGKLSFQDIRFSYPTRPDTPVLRKFNLDIYPGQTVALVGPSGSGKSTIIQLLERYYDPLEGSLLVDDVPLREINLPYYRKNVGLVSQEPTLFSGTIKENILFGNPEATMEQVEEAAKQANAYEFIMNQPDGFDTKVGEKGTQLSGGQKQRLAIARAILKNPRILLLDEATSALDTESESLVQDALDKLMKGRTTIIVAHRLSTIRNADVIVVMKKGKVVEIGNHYELFELNGLYTSLVNKQMISAEKKLRTSLKKSSIQPLKKSEL